MPSARASSTFQAAPMPNQARPPDSTSSVVVALIHRPGWRYGTAPTISPRRSPLCGRPCSQARSCPRASAPRPRRRCGSGRGGPSPRSSRSRPRRRPGRCAPSVGPMAASPPGHVNELTCSPSFTAARLYAESNEIDMSRRHDHVARLLNPRQRRAIGAADQHHRLPARSCPPPARQPSRSRRQQRRSSSA